MSLLCNQVCLLGSHARIKYLCRESMSSFFEEEGSSEEERAEKQRKRLDSIKAVKITYQRGEHSTSRAAADEEENQLLSEEQELKKLRESSRYQKYAEGRKRQRCSSPRASVSPEPRRGNTASENSSGSEVNEQASRNETDQRKWQLQAALEESIVTRGERRREKATVGPVIDPKIIDDSSDEESDSGEDPDDSDDGPIGPALPGMTTPREEELVQTDMIPVQNEATLGDSHSSYTSTMSMDRAGNRLASGSIDSTVYLYDFNSMNRALRSFRTVNPLGEAPVRNLHYSATGSLLLCSGGTSWTVVMDRDGVILSQTAKGDMYIVDMSRTKGHTGPILSARWRPNSKIIASSSADGTVRLWDVNKTERNPMVDNPVISQLRVTKLRNSKGGKSLATAMDWDGSGKFCVLGCSDGRIKIINPDVYSMRPEAESGTVIQQGVEITSVTVSPNSSTAPLICVRSTDDALRVFDRRMMTSPVKEFHDLPNAVSETNVCFIGETGQHFMTGTSAKRKGGGPRGSVRLFDARQLREVWKSETEEDTGSVVTSLWHDKINQLFYGSADGKVRVLYHPSESKKGVLNCLMKSDFRKKHGVVNLGVGEIFTPSTLHAEKSARGKKIHGGVKHNKPLSSRGRREASDAMRPKQYSGPLPASTDNSRSLAKHLASGQIEKDWTLDPREAILRYADVAKKDPIFTSAYQETQPETLLAAKTAEQEEEESRRAIYERDRIRRAKLQSKKP